MRRPWVYTTALVVDHQVMNDFAPPTIDTRQVAPGFATAQVVLKPRKARPFFGRHPWVLDSAVARVEGNAADGDVVDLLTDTGKFVARGIINSQSRIRVRLYSWENAQALDDAFWRSRLEQALALRTNLGLDDPAGGARLVFSEADWLSGLVVDRYAQWLSVQVTGPGALRVDWKPCSTCCASTCNRAAFSFAPKKEWPAPRAWNLRDALHWGEAPRGPAFIEENGLRYGLDLAEGQKTGFYLDQRDNRLAAARYFRDRRVLDMFCYSGGFSLNASRHGHAREVIGFDSSEKAVSLAQANAPAQQRDQRPVREVGLLQGAGRTDRQPREVWRGDLGSAQIRPQPRFAGRGAAGLPSAEPAGCGRAGAGRNPGDLQLLRARLARGLLIHAAGGG